MPEDEFTALPKQSAEEAKNGKVYVQFDLREDILKPLAAVQKSQVSIHKRVGELATTEQLRDHANQFAHTRLIKSIRWAAASLGSLLVVLAGLYAQRAAGG